MKTKEIRISYSLTEAVEQKPLASEKALKDLEGYLTLLKSLSTTASKQTHYHKLNDWSDVAYGYVHDMLKKYDFKNGGPDQNDNARFWWTVYGMVSSIHYSTFLTTNVALHHSSAFERNEALTKEIEYLINA